MARSRTICIQKRNGTGEAFDRNKLRACLLRVLDGQDENFSYAHSLSAAILCYLRRRKTTCITSAALLEIVLAALRSVGLPEAADRLEQHYMDRADLRSRLRITHDEAGLATSWSKDWLVQQAVCRWGMSSGAAKALAGEVEQRLADRRGYEISREKLLEMLDGLAESYGLTVPCVEPLKQMV